MNRTLSRQNGTERLFARPRSACVQEPRVFTIGSRPKRSCVGERDEDPNIGLRAKDLDRGRVFYERQGEGLGAYFLDSLFAEIDSLVLYAGIHRKVFGFHRLLAHRFPYGVYYRLEEQSVIVVWRVLDLRQSPAAIGEALQ